MSLRDYIMRLTFPGRDQERQMTMKEHFALLGYSVRDKLTGRAGVVVSISFDISGCVQALLSAPADKDGKTDGSQWWCDTKRLYATSGPHTDVPDFAHPPGGEADMPMPATKPAR